MDERVAAERALVDRYVRILETAVKEGIPGTVDEEYGSRQYPSIIEIDAVPLSYPPYQSIID